MKKKSWSVYMIEPQTRGIKPKKSQKKPKKKKKLFVCFDHWDENLHPLVLFHFYFPTMIIPLRKLYWNLIMPFYSRNGTTIIYSLFSLLSLFFFFLSFFFLVLAILPFAHFQCCFVGTWYVKLAEQLTAQNYTDWSANDINWCIF